MATAGVTTTTLTKTHQPRTKELPTDGGFAHILLSTVATAVVMTDMATAHGDAMVRMSRDAHLLAPTRMIMMKTDISRPMGSLCTSSSTQSPYSDIDVVQDAAEVQSKTVSFQREPAAGETKDVNNNLVVDATRYPCDLTDVDTVDVKRCAYKDCMCATTAGLGYVAYSWPSFSGCKDGGCDDGGEGAELIIFTANNFASPMRSIVTAEGTVISRELLEHEIHYVEFSENCVHRPTVPKYSGGNPQDAEVDEFSGRPLEPLLPKVKSSFLVFFQKKRMRCYDTTAPGSQDKKIDYRRDQRQRSAGTSRRRSQMCTLSDVYTRSPTRMHLWPPLLR